MIRYSQEGPFPVEPLKSAAIAFHTELASLSTQPAFPGARLCPRVVASPPDDFLGRTSSRCAPIRLRLLLHLHRLSQRVHGQIVVLHLLNLTPWETSGVFDGLLK